MYRFVVESEMSEGGVGCHRVTWGDSIFKITAILSAKSEMGEDPDAFHAYVKRNSDGKIVWEKRKC